MRKELIIGLFIQSINLAMKHFFNTPDLFSGMLQGISLGLIIIGIIPTKYYSSFKKWKSTTFKSI